jgi:iron-sulfur cluster repair protein YtfE (RIC family)
MEMGTFGLHASFVPRQINHGKLSHESATRRKGSLPSTHITELITVYRSACTTWPMYYRTVTELLEATTTPHGAES